MHRYKQEESPRYHGRDVAIMRGQQAGALVVLGSATPSMESYHNAMRGRYELVTLGQRVFERPLATVRIVDMRTEMATEGADVVLSKPLRDAVAVRLERKEQVLILLNRRGYAAAVLCRQCGRAVECPNCSVTLTLHRGGGAVAVSLLQLLAVQAQNLSALRGAVSGAGRVQGPNGSKWRCRRRFRPRRSPGSTAMPCGGGAWRSCC